MKLTDLRDELTTRADSVDDVAPDLLPGVRRKITQTKRRRTAAVSGFVGCVAVIAALATGVIPGLTKTTPQPAEDIPTDYIKNGITVRGAEGQDRLLKAWVGAPGENTLEFNWIPTTKNVAFYPLCRGGAWSVTSMRVALNGRLLFGQPCDEDATTPSPARRTEVLADAPEWLDLQVGKPVKVTLTLEEATGGTFEEDSTQLAVGIYSTPGTTQAGMPRQLPPTSSADYTKDGYRYRAQIADRKLLGAVVSDPGHVQAKFEITGTGGPLVLYNLCTARELTEGAYSLGIAIPGLPKRTSSCGPAGSTDLGTGNSTTLPAEQTLAAGKKVTVTVTLEDAKGNPVAQSDARIGLGIYQDGQKRAYPAGAGQPDFRLDELVEVAGHNYRLADVRTADATAGRVGLPTPAGRPFLVSYGPSDITDADEVSVLFGGVDGGGSIISTATTPGGMGQAWVPARDGATATLETASGRPTKGKLLLALYLPAD